MKILVYGFGPYKHHTRNVSQKIVQRLNEKYAFILPSGRCRRYLLDKIDKIKPDVITG